tara:strand:- start:381 stop:647 length:267 start_codon:yes stop_codon:yes gene_type:complete
LRRAFLFQPVGLIPKPDKLKHNQEVIAISLDGKKGIYDACFNKSEGLKKKSMMYFNKPEGITQDSPGLQRSHDDFFNKPEGLKQDSPG